MKIKLRQFKSNLSRKYSEESYMFFKRLSKWWDKFLQKGHEKMTVMFIPHNEKNIFNFQVSKFTISFFVVLFLIIIRTSAVALKKNPGAKENEEKLLTKYKGSRAELLKYEELTKKITSLMDDIKPDISDLYQLTAGIENYEEIWKNIKDDNSSADDKQKISNLPEKVIELKNLQRDLKNATNTLKTIKNFINVRNTVVRDTPSGIPNHGHVTSLFGWRRSPFGFGRNFHSGIDIGAPHGTPVRATAPGKVIKAGWGSGYGHIVIIKHKYGYKTFYAHNSSLNVKTGQFVKRGDIISFVGQTGSSTGNHCHYEIRLGNVPINPYPYMSRK